LTDAGGCEHGRASACSYVLEFLASG